jgi:vacuolar protein sorting-associated protein VTA1
MDSLPEELKYLLPYLQRSQELQSREPVVAYYGECTVLRIVVLIVTCPLLLDLTIRCLAKYYAAKLALSKGPKNKNTEKFVIVLLDELETVCDSSRS